MAQNAVGPIGSHNNDFDTDILLHPANRNCHEIRQNEIDLLNAFPLPLCQCQLSIMP